MKFGPPTLGNFSPSNELWTFPAAAAAADDDDDDDDDDGIHGLANI